MGKTKFSYPPSHTDFLWKHRNSSEQSHSHVSTCMDSSNSTRDKRVVVRPPCPLSVLYAEEEEEEVSVYAEEEALNDEEKKDKTKKKKRKESRRESLGKPKSERKERRHGKTGHHTSESKARRREPYGRRNADEVKNPELRRERRERYVAKSASSNPLSPPADMAWKDRKSSQHSHSHAPARTDSSTFVRGELAVVPPAPVADALYPAEFYEGKASVYGEEEARSDKEKKEKKKRKETQRHHRNDGNTLDTKGERTERHEGRKQEGKNPELQKGRRGRRDSKKSSTSHRRSDRSSKTGGEIHLDGHPLYTQPIEQPKGVTKPTEVDCDRLLKQLLHAQREMLKSVTGENNAVPPASHPLIATWDQDFKKAFDAFTRDTTTENFEQSFGEISHEYFLSKDPQDKSCHKTTTQKGVVNAGALEETTEKKQVQTGDEVVEISKTRFYPKEIIVVASRSTQNDRGSH